MLLKETSDISPEQKNELKKLVKACFNHIDQYTLPSLIYHFNLLDRPPAVTWKEFEIMLQEWKKSNNKIRIIEQLIEEHSLNRHLSMNEVTDTLFETIIDYRKNLLEKASNSYILEEHSHLMEENHYLLQLIEQLIKQDLPNKDLTCLLKWSGFLKYLSMVETWIHFNENKTDQKTHKREKNCFYIGLICYL